MGRVLVLQWRTRESKWHLWCPAKLLKALSTLWDVTTTSWVASFKSLLGPRMVQEPSSQFLSIMRCASCKPHASAYQQPTPRWSLLVIASDFASHPRWKSQRNCTRVYGYYWVKHQGIHVLQEVLYALSCGHGKVIKMLSKLCSVGDPQSTLDESICPKYVLYRWWRRQGCLLGHMTSPECAISDVSLYTAQQWFWYSFASFANQSLGRIAVPWKIELHNLYKYMYCIWILPLP